jgi:hypothetical protein
VAPRRPSLPPWWPDQDGGVLVTVLILLAAATASFVVAAIAASSGAVFYTWATTPSLSSGTNTYVLVPLAFGPIGSGFRTLFGWVTKRVEPPSSQDPHDLARNVRDLDARVRAIMEIEDTERQAP